jgi:hypothetical protein
MSTAVVRQNSNDNGFTLSRARGETAAAAYDRVRVPDAEYLVAGRLGP